MKAQKKKIDTLTKCYAVSPLKYKGEELMLIAAEKQDACNLYDLNGKKLSVIWDGPGGTMSIVPLSEPDGAFLATQRFYSPNDSADANIVYVAPENIEQNKWKIRKVLDMPFLHRFDILERGGVKYLFMCTIKSAHQYKDDWTSPGKVYAGILPNNFDGENAAAESFKLKEIKSGLTKNHGYTKDVYNGVETAIVSAENGVFRFTPPETSGSDWKIETIIDTPASDAIMADLNGDGKKEMLVISPFHGDNICIYEDVNGTYKKVYEHPEPAEFSHAITSGTVFGKEYVFIGHRKGKRRLFAFYYGEKNKCYAFDVLDEDAGGANAALFEKDGKALLAVTNREIDEIALYELLP